MFENFRFSYLLGGDDYVFYKCIFKMRLPCAPLPNAQPHEYGSYAPTYLKKCTLSLQLTLKQIQHPLFNVVYQKPNNTICRK